MGAEGGYRLVAGSRDAAAAARRRRGGRDRVRAADGRPASAVAGIDEASIRALAKLEQVLPTRLRAQVGAWPARRRRAGPRPDHRCGRADVARARDHRPRTPAVPLRCRRRDREPPHGRPERLVVASRRWYLLAWDVDRDDWRHLPGRSDRGPVVAAGRVPRRRAPDERCRRLRRGRCTTWRRRTAATATPHTRSNAPRPRSPTATRLEADRRARRRADQPRRHARLAGVPPAHARVRVRGPRAAGARDASASPGRASRAVRQVEGLAAGPAVLTDDVPPDHGGQHGGHQQHRDGTPTAAPVAAATSTSTAASTTERKSVHGRS